MASERCAVSECSRRIAARGLCWQHYMRQRRHGDALKTERRYRLHHCCKFCGTVDPDDFYSRYKGICKLCKKVRSILSGAFAGNEEPSPAG